MYVAICRILLLILLIGQAVGCRKASVTTGDKTFPLHGSVVAIDRACRNISVRHDAIPGLMEAMTMPYTVENSSSIDSLRQGDIINAQLHVQKAQNGELQHLELSDIRVTGHKADSAQVADIPYNTPTAGQAVPDFHFQNQDGKEIHLQQFNGKILLITWIYTRCPVADFCPKMSRYFAEINNILKQNPAQYSHTHLLSISFDPAYDTPKVLKSYGEAYLGDYTNSKFDHWEFVSPKKINLNEMEHFFQIGVVPNGGNSIEHSLSTVLIGSDGKILAWYPDGDWTPSQILSDIRKSLVIGKS